ncbi:hypothetical protein MHBO_000712 [Bonamia ostreae]|uniref:GYF domain-containing protein n=1 Tax=Bonamia ostreae TaxID=126728 RepID=A0ABV2AH81_9EUKA
MGESAYAPIQSRRDCDFAGQTNFVNNPNFPSTNIINAINNRKGPETNSRNSKIPDVHIDNIKRPDLQSPDYEEPKWFYVGQNGSEFGPFSSDQMRKWWFANKLSGDLIVRKERESLDMAKPIKERKCCFKHEQSYFDRLKSESSKNESEKPSEKPSRLSGRKLETRRKVVENISKLSAALDNIDSRNFNKNDNF